jgi:histidinol-phosphate/aromatic aminotransferase/cobyric acid decarboxylase-like protein
MTILNADPQCASPQRGFSRRNFGKLAAVLTSLPFYNEFSLAQAQDREERGPMPPDAVRISGNENPLGPCKEACEAVAKVVSQGGRYDPNGENAEFHRTAASMEGLKRAYVAGFAGSADPLHRTIAAFTAPDKPLVTGNPGYEAPERTAEFIGAKVIRVPLQADGCHDVKAMVKASPAAGVYYICNPNNPTGTITRKEDIEWLLANKTKGSIVLLDEAYIHFSKDATMGSYLVGQDKELIVLRTFSKAYGMAGIRAGMALGRPDFLGKIAAYGSGRIPVTAAAAAIASMKLPNLIAERRKINTDIRENTLNFLEQKRFTYLAGAQANFFMLNVRQPGKDFSAAMAKEKVFVGRTWPIYPTYSRITVGTKDDMEKFKAALMKVMG